MNEETKTVVLPSTGRTPSARPSTEGSSLAPGAVVGGRYRIEKLLGSGGMGFVWMAEDLEQQRSVAFKEMQLPSLQTLSELAANALLFRREYFAMKKLGHPGTVKVYDCGLMETGNRYITMEVVDGEDLNHIIKRKPLGSADASRVLLELAQTLSFVHSRLFVHCDIKAQNVRVTPNGSVRLMDFGVMHPLGTRASGKIRGTPAYIAPEWLRGSNIDGRVDLYALGVLGFYMVTGKLPFRHKNVTDIFRAHLDEPAPKASSYAEVDPALEAILGRLLEKDPKHRYQSAAELMAALCAASGKPLIEEPLAARASYLHIPIVVGRDREMAELTSRLNAAQGFRSRALLIGAPAGVGKSRLLQEFELNAKLSDIPFAQGQCRPEGLAPRAPIEQALRALLPLTPPTVLEQYRPVLGHLFPTLVIDDAPVFRDESEEQIAIFEAMTAWLRQLAGLRPFVICLEDLHWADGTTLEYMNVIIRALDSTGGLVIGAFRSDELGRLSRAFQTVDENLSDYLELAPLSEAHLAALVELVLHGFRMGEAFAKNLYAKTKGNVFFATECLRALIEEGALKRVGGKWHAAFDLDDRPLPHSIKDAVVARLSTLSSEHIAFFRQLAPVGRVLDLPLIEAITDVTREDTFDLLDEGMERQFLQYAEGRYFFTHDTVREAIYESTPDKVRRGYHGIIAEYFQRESTDDPKAMRAIGYHFARSLQPTRAIAPLLAAAEHALADKVLLEAFHMLEEAAKLLEAYPDVPHRNERLIATWGKLVEVAYTSSTPACILYADKLFRHWDATVDLASGQAAACEQLAKADAASGKARGVLLERLFREIPIHEVQSPTDIFLKRAEYRILESIALAIMGRLAEFQAGLERTQKEHPQTSPYRAGAMIAIGGLTAHTGHFRGVVSEMRQHVHVLRSFRTETHDCSRRLGWALGMGAYFMNMNLALMGCELDAQATSDGFEVADTLGFTDLRIYHLFSQIVRASFVGDGAAFMPPFKEMNDLMRKLGKPRLPERNLAIYTPPYYLEREDLELATAVVERGEYLSKLIPGDRWLKLYAQVYRACLGVLTADPHTKEAIDQALAASRAADFRMETLVLVYQSRFELQRHDLDAATRAAEAAMARAIDPLRENPFDQILALRALAAVQTDESALGHLYKARAIAETSKNVLQEGIVAYTLADTIRSADPAQATLYDQVAEACFVSARAERWLRRVRSRHIEPISERGVAN